MSRYEELKQVLDQRRYFKIVCGAGNEDCDEVRKLSLVYTLAGATGIDVSANPEVVSNAVLGVERAVAFSRARGREIFPRPFINVSIGMKGDPHIRKAEIASKVCIQCGKCLDVCLQKAISKTFVVMQKRCIGCGQCAKVCSVEAVSFSDTNRELKAILPECLRRGAETFELHAIIEDDASVMADWNLLNEILRDNFISMCLDRSQLSDVHLMRRIRQAQEIARERLIIQADGVPMSGGADDFNTTLQAVAIADIIRKNNVSVYVLASGGTNSTTGELACLCGVVLHGVSIGTFARKIVGVFIDDPQFEKDEHALSLAVKRARELVDANLEKIHG